jgi:hypothetical protein
MEEEYIFDNDDRYEELNKKFETGFDLFKKYFNNLWD